MAAIAGYVPSAKALRRLLEALPPNLLGDAWASILRLLQHPKLDPNAIWPIAQFTAIKAVVAPRGKVNVWTLPELEPLWAMGVDVVFKFPCDHCVDCRRLVPRHLADMQAFGFQCSATINVARGVWTSCVIRLLPSSTVDDVKRYTSAVAAMPSLRHVIIDLSQIAYTLEFIPPQYEHRADVFPAALEPHVWSTLSPSHIRDVTILGSNLLATTKGVRSAIQWLSSRPLRRLCLAEAKVDAHTVTAFVTAMRDCTTLSTIELSYDLVLLPAFLSVPLPRHLRRLRLFVSDEPYHAETGWHKITSLPVALVTTAIAGSALTHLSIDLDSLDDQSAAAIVSTAFKHMPCLDHLELLNVRCAPHLDAVLDAGAARIAALESMRLQEPIEDYY
ncbi:hypothetical protein SPRG_15902 [Saprolegnia parasitica CBS 223.65]|uniref:Uncharacterized protein n=1 Tax=Saprolegnia parasitica (strain CBS 223.65) TaxID=695850 RepID=A0A067BKN4_SAPPC|nr:hypothetical protein SPRG_15902 [Saprolegnia parasitica CBS 223.65]KDO18733.1 hypothetical protein SPRG_15902 [Saprolegnia parasitica CBS 223.65]|eukprot:XP_012210559.1 hypothetical protein SPRG_15902 [Saprolegnia parasitica CBS 223.65]